MTSEEACQQFIDTRLPKELQPIYTDFVKAYRAAWAACQKFNDAKISDLLKLPKEYADHFEKIGLKMP